MSKLRVIDLLNKIANGEEVPEKIRFKSDIWVRDFEGAYYYYKEGTDDLLLDFIGDTNLLNKEVEIIEEDKKIEKLGYCCVNKNGETRNFVDVEEVLKDKINEIIDRLNGDSDE